jgi:molybdate transport system substrate-binding protein
MIQIGSILVQSLRASVMRKTFGVVLGLALFANSWWNTASSADVKVLSANGVKAIMLDLASKFESSTGNKVTFEFGEAGEIKTQILNGESFDVSALPGIVLEDLVKQKKIVAGSTINIAHSSFGMGVRAGGPKPDVNSADAFKRSLLAAKTIVVTDPATGGVSGVHFASVLQRLGIAEEIKSKLKLTKGTYNSEFVARGEADIAVQAEHEIRCVPGIEFVQFPVEFQRTVVFAAGLGANGKDIEASRSFIHFISGPAAVSVIKAKCMEPGGN